MHIDIREALRYLGVRANASDTLTVQMKALAQTVEQDFPPRWSWQAADVTWAEGIPSVAGIDLPGRSAARMLADCHRAALLICTLGMDFERQMRQEQVRDMARAVLLDALGSAWVEAGCDAAEAEIASRFPGMYLTDRFSPGYGDLPLTTQSELLALLDAPRRLGVYETDTHLMAPQKSVTAIIGIAERPQMARIRGCGHCQMRNICTLRKVGKTCEV